MLQSKTTTSFCRVASGGSVAFALLALTARCGTYESGSFSPLRQIHEVRLAGEEQSVATVEASIVGVLRPHDGDHGRVHARLKVKNPGSGSLSLASEACRLTPSGVVELIPDNPLVRVDVAPGASRTVDLLFSLPPRGKLPRGSLAEVELSWKLDIAGTPHRSSATFQRRRRSRPYATSGAWSYGSGWYDPYYGSYWGGPYWGPHFGFGYYSH